MEIGRPTSPDAPRDVEATTPTSADFGRRQWFSDAQREELAADAAPKSEGRDPKFLDGVTARKFFTKDQREHAATTDAPPASIAITRDTHH